MCGIIGQINHAKPIELAEFNQMRDTLIHRGPDDAHSILLNKGNVAFGHRRLSFLDLSKEGRQPMCNEDESLCLSFNGEIYNYKTIKASLPDFNFTTDSDTEVVLAAFMKWGEQCVKYL